MNKVDYIKPTGWTKVNITNRTIVTLKSGAIIPSWSAMERKAKKIR